MNSNIPLAQRETEYHGRFRLLVRARRYTSDQIDVVALDLPVNRLPAAFVGLRACQLSDFHLDADVDLLRLEDAVGIVNAEHPDVVFLTGDYFSGPESMLRYIGEFGRTLQLLRPSRGTFAIAGNHDHSASFWKITEALQGADVHVLANENYLLKLGDSRLYIVGIDDLWSQRAQPLRAFHGVPRSECTVLLAHNPDTAIYARHLKPGVVISGHAHGGIIRFPLLGSPLRSFLQIGRQFYSGLNRYHDFYVYTNRGLGNFPLSVRINCRPEISVFIARPAILLSPAYYSDAAR